jgi:hypothetical protein
VNAKAGWLVVAAVCLLGLVAAADGLRGRVEPTPAPAPTAVPVVETTEPAPVQLTPLPLRGPTGSLAMTLGRDGVRGVLFFTDERCRLWGLVLPAVDWLDRRPRPSSCGFTLQPGGRITVPTVRGPALGPSARCQEGRSPGIGPLRSACAVARKPDGTLTVATAEGVLACAADRRSCPDVLLPQADVERAVQVTAPGGSLPTGWLVTQIGWLSDTRLAVVVHVTWEPEGASEDVLAVFEGRQLVNPPVESAEFADLRISPHRNYFVARGRTFRGLWFFDSDGRVLTINPVASGHHAAWSPDERWIAVATGGSVYLFRTSDLPVFERGARPELVRIPVYATDIAWG